MIKRLDILGGVGRDNGEEPLREVCLELGDVVSVVGATGSGKTTLIDDIALFADRNTPSKRRVLINGAPAPDEFFSDPSRNPVAFITQHTNFLSDMPVNEFLRVHAGIRRRSEVLKCVNETVDFANQLTGEPLDPGISMTELSGGQTRALLIADAVIIGASPIILLDEIENAGIDRGKALELLKRYEKIFIFVTHDPRIAMLSDSRIVMSSGAMVKQIFPGREESEAARQIEDLDARMTYFRKLIRDGEILTPDRLQEPV